MSSAFTLILGRAAAAGSSKLMRERREGRVLDVRALAALLALFRRPASPSGLEMSISEEVQTSKHMQI